MTITPKAPVMTTIAGQEGRYLKKACAISYRTCVIAIAVSVLRKAWEMALHTEFKRSLFRSWVARDDGLLWLEVSEASKAFIAGKSHGMGLCWKISAHIEINSCNARSSLFQIDR